MVVGILGFLAVAAVSWLKSKMQLDKEAMTTGVNGMKKQSVKCVDMAFVEAIQIVGAGFYVNGMTAVASRV